MISPASSIPIEEKYNVSIKNPVIYVKAKIATNHWGLSRNSNNRIGTGVGDVKVPAAVRAAALFSSLVNMAHRWGKHGTPAGSDRDRGRPAVRSIRIGASSRGGLENHHHSEQTINCHVRPWFQATQKYVTADQARGSQANPELDLDDALKRHAKLVSTLSL